MDTRIALVGIGGYGEGYVRELLQASVDRGVHLVAGVDPAPERCRLIHEFYRAGIPIYASLEDFFTRDQADLVIISSPIQLHAAQTCLSLAQGSHVLCEKPVCVTIQDARRMAEAERQSGKLVAIGYQWSYTPAIQALKRDIMAGVFGYPKRLKTLVLWPRPASYYQRNRWAGRIRNDTGDWVLDSPANNAMAHYLHNLLYVLGNSPNTSARPVSIQAELYRANPIENYDTAALRVVTEGNVEVLFYGTHAIPEVTHPTFCLEFEMATIEFSAYSETGITARFQDGSTRDYGDPFAPGVGWEKLWQTVDSIKRGKPTVCGISAASAHTLCINGAQESTEIIPVPQESIRQVAVDEADQLTWVIGLQEAFLLSYAQGCLPVDSGALPWARTGKVFDLRNYEHFPALS
jgi:predicted dehydrogenase